MKINKIAPYEGELVWLGEMRKGVSQKGKEWQSIDFVIKYNDGKYDKHLNIQAFGAEKVGLLMSTPIGSTLRVEWEPDSHEYNGKWYTKASAIEVSVLEKQEPEQTGTLLPDGAVMHPRTQAPTFPNATTVSNEDDKDLPFSQSPGA